jgi:hypothetical protein
MLIGLHLDSLFLHDNPASFLSHLSQLLMMPTTPPPILTNIIIIPSFSHSFMSHTLKKKEGRSTTTLSLHNSIEVPSSLP